MIDSTPHAAAPPPTLTVHQVVAYNFARARRQAGWTQVETGLRLAPYLGYRLTQAGVSAIEKTYDSGRRRNIDAAEVVAFACCFDRPIGWFFLPPTGRSSDGVEPVRGEILTPINITVSELTTLVVGTPRGRHNLLERLDELLVADSERTLEALRSALHGSDNDGRPGRRIRSPQLSSERDVPTRGAVPLPEVVITVARLLVQLVDLTSQGSMGLRRATKSARAHRSTRVPRHGVTLRVRRPGTSTRSQRQEVGSGQDA